jgi:hypothetical protein
VQVLGLIPLTCGAGVDIVLHRRAKVGRVEVAAETVQRALDALMSVVVHKGEHLVEQGRRRWDVEVAVKTNEPVAERLGRRTCARRQLLLECHQHRVCGRCLT